MAYSLKQLNEAIRSDPQAFVDECDAAFHKKVETAAQKIAGHRAESASSCCPAPPAPARPPRP